MKFIKQIKFNEYLMERECFYFANEKSLPKL